MGWRLGIHVVGMDSYMCRLDSGGSTHEHPKWVVLAAEASKSVGEWRMCSFILVMQPTDERAAVSYHFDSV